jgi:hypothetical protein
VIIAFAHRRLVPLVALAAAIEGAIAALQVHRLGLTLSHYDARGHLVVARRIFDSITPGWQQVGAVWLPLPHLLNALPVQIDWLYRSGASAVAMSIASFAAAAAAIAWIVRRITTSDAAALVAAVVLALNPNLLYLQATPMTEPLMIALLAVGVAMLVAADVEAPVVSASSRAGADPSARPVRRTADTTMAGVVLALACLTRYEAWPVTAAAVAIFAWARWRGGKTLRDAVVVALRPAVAVLGFLVFSRVVVGEWFVGGGFFVPENKALGDAAMAAREIGWSVERLSGSALVWIAAGGLVALSVVAALDRARAGALVVLSLAATAAIPFAAFYRGHPFRIRYGIPLIAIEAVGCGLAVGLIPRARLAAAAAVLAVAALTLGPADRSAPMIVEAQWDRPNVPVRARVTACLGPPQPGQKIMASMGSLAHYMQEASGAGYRLRDFLHEGNGDIWLAAIERPRPFADWILIEEKAEGGDMLARLAREHPHFLDGYSRVCDGAGLALYKRSPDAGARSEN